MNRKGLLYSAVAGLLIMVSCDKAEMGPVILDNPTAPVITAPAAESNIEITEGNFGDVLEFVWTASDYGFEAAVNYTVQADVGDNGFAEPVELFNSSELKGSINYEELNNKLLAAGAIAGASNDLMFRVVSSISVAVEDLISEAVTMAVSPLLVEISYPVLNIPGSYQGWDPANTLTVIYSLKSDEVYDGYIYFGEEAVEFKFAKGSWDENWGDTGNDGTLDASGDNIKATGPAMYRLSADLNTHTYTAIQTDWGLIGSATPGAWDSDQDLTYDVDAGVLTITLDLVEGELKFRANDDWDLNLGDDQANGIMEYDGANIVVESAGNYTIILDLRGALIKYSVIKN